MLISLIIPVYNRPQETEELLKSLTLQSRKDFEVVIVEDGSTAELSSAATVERFRDRLNIVYVSQPNSGPAIARNTGAAHAHGDFFVIMDSDCLVPPEYFETVYGIITACNIEFYGGPDSAGADFSPLQKAVSYSMTSLFTTGGIRGNKRTLDNYTPRSFNLGISRRAFEAAGGFSDMRIGEDIDFSLRIKAAGTKAFFIPQAAVFHKRRTSMKLFFKQVFIFGTARINLNLRHPESVKLLYALPAIFTAGSAILILASFVFSWKFMLTSIAVAFLWQTSGLGTAGGFLLYMFGAFYGPEWFWIPFGLLMLLWFADSSIRNRSIRIGWLSVWTSFIQLYGYGLGFLYGIWMRYVLRKDEAYTYRVTKMFSKQK